MRRLGALLFVGVVAVALVWWLVHYLTNGRIIITSDNPHNTITLTQVSSDSDDDDDSNKNVFSKQGHSELNVAAHTGRYVASVQGNSVATTQVIQLGAHQTLRYTLNPITTTGMEPVAYEDAHSLEADGSHLLYVNLTDEGLYQIDGQNNTTRLAPDQRFQNVQWASTALGVGQADSGLLYAITGGGAVRHLEEPTSAYNGKLVHYAVATNGQIYLSIGLDVYRGSATGSFTKIYTSSTPFTSLAAWGNTVAVINSPVDGPGGTTPAIAIISGSKQVTKKKIEASPTVVWSPGGTYLATTNEGGLVIFDNSLHNLATIPGNSVNGVAWLNDHTVLYGGGGQIWAYDLNSRRANVFANVPLGNTATELSVSTDGDYVYTVVEDSSNNLQVKRVGLRNQTVPGMVYQLQDILPESLSDFSLSLVNFSHPTVLIQPDPDAQPQNFQQAAAAALQQDGFDTSQLELRVVPIGQQ